MDVSRAIKYFQYKLSLAKQFEEKVHPAESFALDAMLAEEKRQKGCKHCKRTDKLSILFKKVPVTVGLKEGTIGTFGSKYYVVGSPIAKMSLAGYTEITHCPFCGRQLPPIKK